MAIIHNGQEVLVQKALVVPPSPNSPWGLAPQLLSPATEQDYLKCQPPSVKHLLEEISQGIGVSPILAGTMLMPAVSSLTQCLYKVQSLDYAPDALAIFGLAGARTAAGKTQTFDFLLHEQIVMQRELNEEAKHDLDYAAESLVWSESVKACQAKIRKNFESHEEVSKYKKVLKGLMGSKPEKPKSAMNILLRDTSKSAITKSQFEGCPSVTLVYDEGMNFFNQYKGDLSRFIPGHDGTDLKVDRYNASFYVQDPTQSLMIAVQIKPMGKYLSEHAEEMIDSGFLPRCLIGISSQQKHRKQRNVPTTYRDMYRAVMRGLIKQLRKKLADGDTSKTTLLIRGVAEEQLIATREWLERESEPGGRYQLIPEFINRCAQHIARVAANLHVLLEQPGTEISLETVQFATLIVRWHTEQYLFQFNDVRLPQEQADAKNVMEFIWTVYCSFLSTSPQTPDFFINERYVQQYVKGGGAALRTRVPNAIDFLIEESVLTRFQIGRRIELYLNPIAARALAWNLWRVTY